MRFRTKMFLYSPDNHFPSPVLSQYYSETKFTLLKLHGSMEQCDRVPVYNKFNSCTDGVLFTTDVAARGLDVPVS